MAAAGAARAANIDVSPVRIQLSPAGATTVLTLTNGGDAPAVVQCQLVSWTQHDSEDVYVPSGDLIASPPIFTVPPGKKQLVRIGLRRPPQGTQETAYRIYLQEIPGPPKPGFQGLRMALRLGIPIFVAPAEAVKPQLRWSARLEAGGKTLSIELQNSGSAHVQVLDFVISQPPAGETVARETVPVYVLAGQSRRWILKPLERSLHVAEDVHLKANTDSGEFDEDLVLEGR
jgi:fimbrial chaperone protein